MVSFFSQRFSWHYGKRLTGARATSQMFCRWVSSTPHGWQADTVKATGATLLSYRCSGCSSPALSIHSPRSRETVRALVATVMTRRMKKFQPSQVRSQCPLLYTFPSHGVFFFLLVGCRLSGSPCLYHREETRKARLGRQEVVMCSGYRKISTR